MNVKSNFTSKAVLLPSYFLVLDYFLLFWHSYCLGRFSLPTTSNHLFHSLPTITFLPAFILRQLPSVPFFLIIYYKNYIFGILRKWRLDQFVSIVLYRIIFFYSSVLVCRFLFSKIACFDARSSSICDRLSIVAVYILNFVFLDMISDLRNFTDAEGDSSRLNHPFSYLTQTRDCS